MQSQLPGTTNVAILSGIYPTKQNTTIHFKTTIETSIDISFHHFDIVAL